MRVSILHISPTYYSSQGVIGGGEKYVIYMSRALRLAAASRGLDIPVSIVAFGEPAEAHQVADGVTCEVLAGRPWDPLSISLRSLTEAIDGAGIVIVHQCLTAFGLFAASHARLANKFVIGVDEGGGEHPLVHHTRNVGRIFDLFHAYSEFCVRSFDGLDGRIVTRAGPVDTSYYRPDFAKTRDRSLVLAVGRILPHKGFESIIRALPRDMRLVIAGSGVDREYHQYLLTLAMGRPVEIRERLSDDEVLSLMQTARVFVQASTHVDYRGRYYAKPELLGLAALEALSAGTPALVSGAAALPELTSVAGCLQFAGEAELASILEKHLSFDELFPSPGEIHQQVEQQYGLASFGREFLDAIDIERCVP